MALYHHKKSINIPVSILLHAGIEDGFFQIVYEHISGVSTDKPKDLRRGSPLEKRQALRLGRTFLAQMPNVEHNQSDTLQRAIVIVLPRLTTHAFAKYSLRADRLEWLSPGKMAAASRHISYPKDIA